LLKDGVVEEALFALDERLKRDCYVLGSFPLSLLLMSRDANYPWFILVPQRDAINELYQLEGADYQQLTAESRHLSEVVMAVFAGDKLNVAALGNMVPQLHIHHIVRYEGDPAWPNPVWGAVPGKVFATGDETRRAEKLLARLGESFKAIAGFPA